MNRRSFLRGAMAAPFAVALAPKVGLEEAEGGTDNPARVSTLSASSSPSRCSEPLCRMEGPHTLHQYSDYLGNGRSLLHVWGSLG